MAKGRRRNRPEHDSDYDGAWKESARAHFHEMLEKYFPATAALIDWSYPPIWSDKELSRILARSRRRPQSVDMLAKVRLLSGGEQWILLHFFRLIDWMMNLRDDLSRKFEQELTVLEESLNMPYVTSVERIAEERGEARGEARGRAEGSASVLLKQLGLVCGPIPDAVAQRVRGLSFEALETLSETLLNFRSLHDVQAWLDAHDASGR